MCGIAGVIAWDEKLAADRPALAAMSEKLRHRGPDGEGIRILPGAGLVHRRLAILDPDPRSDQPFTDGLRWLVFNGEIYNFRELRREIDSLRPGYAWKTTGDTEVLLRAYDAWGAKCVEHLNGMFAFAVWDGRELFLARDRMGQKPLYLAVSPGRVAFASELAALMVGGREIRRDGLVEYLRYGWIGGERTIYEGVEKIPPAHWRLISSGSDSGNVRYWDANERGPTAGTAKELIEAAVRRQLVSDVPLGCFLSGGVDSSVIAAAMKENAGRVLTFSIGFDDPRYDETKYAEAVARHLGTEHQSSIVRPNAAEDLPRLAAVFGEPFGDSSALPTHYLARQTRQFVKVALSGDGGDELFGGYNRYQAMRWGAAARNIPSVVRRLGEKLPGNHPKSRSHRLRRFLRTLDEPAPKRYASYLRLFDDTQIAELLGEPAVSADGVEAAFSAIGGNPVTAAMATDRITYLPDDVLTKVDRASMLHALEVRSPFLDPDVVRFAAGLPPEMGRKKVLRDAFAADLPAWVFRRKKMGFALPIGDWLRTSLKPMLNDLLFSSNSFAAARFQLPTLRRIVDQHESGGEDHSQRLYSLLMLELWSRMR